MDVGIFARLCKVWQQVSFPTASGDPDEWPERLARMELVQSAIASDGTWSYGPSTLMSVLGISRREVANCRVVRWLLDPLARHGIGADMVAALGDEIGRDLKWPSRARAEAEVTRPRSRADVVVTGAGNEWIVVIEAKVAAGEGPEQGHRLEQDWTEGASSAATHLVFLTPEGRRLPRTARARELWTALSWGWFAEAGHQLLDASPTPANERAEEARHALQEWLTAVQRSLQ